MCAEAIACLEKALEFQPDDDVAHRDMGAALAAQGLPQAVAYYQRALEAHPSLLMTRKRLAAIYRAQGNAAAYVTECKRILEYTPDDVETRMKLGLAYMKNQQIDLAAQQFEIVLNYDQNHQKALIYLAYAVMNNNSARAVQLTRRAAQLSGYRDAVSLYALAASYFANGDPATGTTYAKRARKIASATGNTELLKKIDQVLQSYQLQGRGAGPMK